MKHSRRIVTGLAVLFLVAGAAALPAVRAMEGPIQAGRIVLSRTVQLGDVTLKRGTYRVQLVPKDEGMFIQFVRKNQVVAEDLTIERPARYSRTRPRVRVTKVWNQNFLKVTVHYGDTYYLSFLPIP